MPVSIVGDGPGTSAKQRRRTERERESVDKDKSRSLIRRAEGDRAGSREEIVQRFVIALYARH